MQQNMLQRYSLFSYFFIQIKHFFPLGLKSVITHTRAASGYRAQFTVKRLLQRNTS